ncbi:MAG: YHS domain-containing protein [Polyangiaceae bacterium]|nr:YHS domain-containing protein [Polyangiaceae bacterium]
MDHTEWLDLARKLDWEFSYVSERDVFPEEMAGRPFLDGQAWRDWEEPFRTTFAEYVTNQHEKDTALYAVRDALGKAEDLERLPREWLNALKLHAAALPLAEFDAVVGNLRGARFGRDGAWRTAACLGALDEFRHTQIPLVLMHEMVRHDRQFDWTHRFYHSNDWVAIAARHVFDELLLASNAIEFAVATNFVFETGFTNLQFVGLSALAHKVGDRMFETMVNSIQSDEARHAQIGGPVLAKLVEHDRRYAQYLLDKWFWRNWLLFAVVTGFSMDYLTPVESRTQSFKEFMAEWVLDQFVHSLDEYGLEKPWYWDTFLTAIDNYHHMVYASAYTYRATVWFDMVVPGPRERTWLRQKYPRSWDAFEPVWDRIEASWRAADPGNDFAVHGTSIVGFCDLCQLVLSNGTPSKNTAVVVDRDGSRYIFCSEPCRWIFDQEPERYANHRDVVKRVLGGEAPANLIALVRRYFGLDYESWGKDAYGGDYPWMKRRAA